MATKLALPQVDAHELMLLLLTDISAGNKCTNKVSIGTYHINNADGYAAACSPTVRFFFQISDMSYVGFVLVGNVLSKLR